MYVTVWQLFLQLTTGILAAYGFARGKFPFKNTLFVLVLGALMIPHQVTFVPLYILIANLDWIDTYAGLVLPGAVSAYFIFMMRQNFMSVDQSYLDAGMMDGLGIIGTIRHVLVPMCRSSIVTVAFITIIDGWNNYFWPKIISKTDATRLLSVGLVQLRDSWEQSLSYEHYNCVMAAVFISLIPVIILFFLNQKYMLQGYSKAAMK
jgi:ABC-type glycerol-3-phosphate transport system permease component